MPSQEAQNKNIKIFRPVQAGKFAMFGQGCQFLITVPPHEDYMAWAIQQALKEGGLGHFKNFSHSAAGTLAAGTVITAVILPLIMIPKPEALTSELEANGLTALGPEGMFIFSSSAEGKQVLKSHYNEPTVSPATATNAWITESDERITVQVCDGGFENIKAEDMKLQIYNYIIAFKIENAAV